MDLYIVDVLLVLAHYLLVKGLLFTCVLWVIKKK